MKLIKQLLLLIFGLILSLDMVAQTNNSPTQTICFGTIHPYRVDWQAPDGLNGTPGSTYNWTLDPAVSGTSSIVSGNGTNNISIDWGTTAPGTYVDAVTVIETTISTSCPGTVEKLTVIIIAIPSAPTIVTNVATCSASGTATISNYSASLTYAFSPTGPTVGALGVISGLTAGTSYTVTAGNGTCTSVPSATFNIAAQLITPAVPIVTTNPATCSADGSATLSNYSSLLTYTFSPIGPTVGALGVISGLTAGTSYTVAAGNGSCTSAPNSPFNIAAQLTTPAVPVVTTNPATCSANGSATVSNYNSLLTYTFSPTGPTVGALGVISGLATGTSYTLTAGNGTCISAPNASFSIAAQSTTPAVPIVASNPATCSADGSATVSNYSGSLTYTFSPIGPSVGALGVISGLAAGTSYTVTAGNGSCTSAPNAPFNIAAQLTTPASPIVTTNPATCSANGSATVSNYNSLLTYTFSPTGPTVGALGVISGLTAGTSYTVTAGDGTCTSASSASFAIATQLTLPAIPTLVINAATCSADGNATVLNYIGTLTYVFSPTGPSVGALGVISGLTAGASYTVTAGNGSCTSTPSVSFNIAAQLTIPTAPTIVINTATCSANGTATVSNYSSLLTYTFSPTGPTVGALGVISGLTAGASYTVTAGNGICTSAPSASFNIDAQLTLPAIPTLVINTATCSADGNATVLNYSGTLTYAFVPTGPTVGALGVISGLVAGTSYTVAAGNGSCTSVPSVSFNVAAQLTTPAIPVIVTNPATCSVEGSATVTNYSGTVTYAFSPTGPSVGALGVISGLAAGTSYTVTAGNGTCTSAPCVSFNIAAQLTTPAVPVIVTNPATCSSDGSATVSNYNGLLTYTFNPIGPTVGALGVISGLTAGTSYTVTAGNGFCTSASTSSFNIAAQLPTPIITLTSGPTCSLDLLTYGAIITVSSGTPTASLGSFSNSGNIWTLSGVSAGVDVTITLIVNGCQAQQLITAPICNCSPITAPVVSNTSYCVGSTIPSFDVTNSPGSGYTINWYNLPTGGTIIGTGASFTPTTSGIYYAQFVENLTLCTSQRTPVTLTVNPLPTTSPIFHD